jgi:hypothetical protein
MPTYQFLDTETGEEFESFMKFSEKESFLVENPHIQTIISAAAIVGGVSIKDKVPDGFKEVLSKISENHKGSSVDDRYGRKSIKEAKTAEVVKKHVDRVSKRTTQ